MSNSILCFYQSFLHVSQTLILTCCCRKDAVLRRRPRSSSSLGRLLSNSSWIWCSSLWLAASSSWIWTHQFIFYDCKTNVVSLCLKSAAVTPDTKRDIWKHWFSFCCWISEIWLKWIIKQTLFFYYTQYHSICISMMFKHFNYLKSFFSHIKLYFLYVSSAAGSMRTRYFVCTSYLLLPQSPFLLEQTETPVRSCSSGAVMHQRSCSMVDSVS